MECLTCVCVWLRAGWEVLRVTGLGLSFTNSGEAWEKWDMCLCFGCGEEWVGGLVQGLGIIMPSKASINDVKHITKDKLY